MTVTGPRLITVLVIPFSAECKTENTCGLLGGGTQCKEKLMRSAAEASSSSLCSNLSHGEGKVHQMSALGTAVRSHGSLGTPLVLLIEMGPHGGSVSSAACVFWDFPSKCKHTPTEEKKNT